MTHTQFKNKWDYLRKQWKAWKECFEHETGLSYDSVTGKFETSDECEKLNCLQLYCILTTGYLQLGMSQGINLLKQTFAKCSVHENHV